MAQGRAALLVAVVGCYSPSATTGAPCDERLLCPSGQVCLAGRCEREGTVLDDAPIADDVMKPDSAMPDAPVMTWSAPTPVGITVGQSKSDGSSTPDRLIVVFERNDDLFMAVRPSIGGAFTVAPLPFNTAFSEKSPEITPDGTTIYFASNPDGNYDIFVTTFASGAWSTPAKVPAWSTASNEQDVAISPDELTAFVAISGDLRRATRMTKSDPWPAPTSVGVTWGSGATAPSINSAGDVYFHASNPRDLFVARRTGTTYAAPVPVTELNTPAGREAAPFISADDRHLMFERDGELVESTR